MTNKSSKRPVQLTLPVRMDAADSIIAAPPALKHAKRRRKRKTKHIENTIAQINGELRAGRIRTVTALAKLASAYERRGAKMAPETFDQVVAILREAASIGSAD